MKEFYRTYADVDLEAIRHNIIEVRKNISRDTKIMSVIKADAYGHGAIQVAEAIDDLVEVFGVAIIEEAIELRKAGFDKDILILGYCGRSWYRDILKYDVMPTICTLDMAKELSEIAAADGKTVKIHVKVDTGMNRIGFEPTPKSANAIKEICELPGIKLEGIFTHLARADEENADAATLPLEKYNRFIGFLNQRGIHVPDRHVSNSAAIINLPGANLDMVRCGISTYGVYPSDEVSRNILHLKPAMSWKAVVSFVKKVPEGTPVSYGGTYVTKRDTVIATVSVGYADGMKRDLSNKGQVLINGEYAPILGRICMDQFMIDVTEISGVNTGDLVTIIGKDGEHEITVEEISGLSHSFSYEFLCGISKRVPRRYKCSGTLI